MTTVTVYDPAMCCSTGICGAEVDQNLVNFAADLDWLKSQGVKVTRINLSQEPAAFAANGTVSAVLQDTGIDGLPVILLGELMHSSGRYPARAELAGMAGVTITKDVTWAPTQTPTQTQSGSCCGGDDEADKTFSGCR